MFATGVILVLDVAENVSDNMCSLSLNAKCIDTVSNNDTLMQTEL